MVGFVLGLVAFFALLAAPQFTPEPVAQKVAAVTALMAIWWITEAAPLPVTALLPMVLFPLLGAASIAASAAPYADPVIYLLFGGFVLAAAMARCGLHKRMGLACIAAIGTTPRRLVGGMMTATALVSVFVVSNSATAALMLPVALAVLAFVEEKCQDIDDRSRHNLAAALMLGVAYGATIGGMSTLISSPPNALMAAYLAREHGIELGFAQYALIGVPLAALMLLVSWGTLCWRHPVSLSLPNVDEVLRDERARAGPMSSAEKRVALIFAVATVAWITRPLVSQLIPGLNDTTIAVAAAFAFFMLPAGKAGGKLAELDDLRQLPWDALLLFGGGLSMAAAVSSSGLSDYLGVLLTGSRALPIWAALVLMTLAITIVTQVTSNTATTATFLPIGGAVAIALGGDPVAFSLAVMLAASSDFMLPVGTPPNAIVYATGRVGIQDMFRAGLIINPVILVLTVVVVLLVAPLILGS